MGVDNESRVPGTKRASSGTASSTASHFSTSARSSLQTSLSTILLTRATPLLSRSWPRSFDGFNGVATAASAASLPCVAAGLVVAERAAVVARSANHRRACILRAGAFCMSAHATTRRQRSDRAQVQRMQLQPASACCSFHTATRPYVEARKSWVLTETNAGQILLAHTQHSACKAGCAAACCSV